MKLCNKEFVIFLIQPTLGSRINVPCTILEIFSTVRLLFKTVRLLDMGQHGRYVQIHISTRIYKQLYCHSEIHSLQNFPPVPLFWTVCLSFLPNIPTSAFIPDRTFISDLRVFNFDLFQTHIFPPSLQKPMVTARTSVAPCFTLTKKYVCHQSS